MPFSSESRASMLRAFLPKGRPATLDEKTHALDEIDYLEDQVTLEALAEIDAWEQAQADAWKPGAEPLDYHSVPTPGQKIDFGHIQNGLKFSLYDKYGQRNGTFLSEPKRDLDRWVVWAVWEDSEEPIILDLNQVGISMGRSFAPHSSVRCIAAYPNDFSRYRRKPTP